MDSIATTLAVNADADAGPRAPLPRYTPEVHDLIGELRRAQAEDGLSGRQVADRAGIPQGTWTSFLGGTYSGDLDRLMAAGRAWLESRQAKRRVAAVVPRAPGYLPLPNGEAIMAALEHCQHAPDLGLFVGAPGIGKTTAARRYAATYSHVWMVTADPSLRSAMQLLDLIRDEMQLPGKDMLGMSRAIARRLRGNGALLVVDEAQNLTTDAVDMARSIHDLAGCGVALLGSEALSVRIEGAAREPKYAQLYSRIGMRLPKLRPGARDVAMLLDAWGIEGEEERKLLRAVAARPGALRLLTKVLRDAAIQAEGARVTTAMIEAAYQRLSAQGLGDVGHG